MKTLHHYSLGLLLFLGVLTTAEAQVSVNVNIGAPVWAEGYPVADYYYLPDINVYYDRPRTQFIYLNRGAWVRSRELPPAYRSYNLRGGRKVVITDYHGTEPYKHYKPQKVKYKSNKGQGHAKGNGHGNGNGHGKH